MKESYVWFLAPMLALASLGVYAKPPLSCDAYKGSTSQSLDITEKGNGAPDFSYLSSTPSQGLALNCMIDSSLVSGAPTVSGNTITYSLTGGDSLRITKQSHGYRLDMSKLDAANYCSGIIAKQVIVLAGKKKCEVQ